MACKSTEPSATPKATAAKTLADLQAQARRFNAVISLPQFETSPAAIHQSVSNTITRANAALDTLGRRRGAELTFANTIHALDDIFYEANLTGNRLSLIKETSTNAAVRDAATDAIPFITAVPKKSASRTPYHCMS